VKIATLSALAALAATFALLAPPMTRPGAYYQFADARTLLGVPHFMDVASGAPWLLVGMLGLLFVARTPAGRHDGPFGDGQERAAFGLLFGAVALIALGSGYFHLAPSAATLLWDRLPMAVAFMSLFAIVLGERIGGPVARALFVPLVALGVGSVLHWHHTEMLGRGDERLYALVQYFPMIVLPVLLLWFPAGTSSTRDLFAVLGFYALSHLFELADRPVFALTHGLISGHTIKHASAVVAAIWLLRFMVGRRTEAGAGSGALANRSPTARDRGRQRAQREASARCLIGTPPTLAGARDAAPKAAHGDEP
jgi:hypothetical protein